MYIYIYKDFSIYNTNNDLNIPLERTQCPSNSQNIDLSKDPLQVSRAL